MYLIEYGDTGTHRLVVYKSCPEKNIPHDMPPEVLMNFKTHFGNEQFPTLFSSPTEIRRRSIGQFWGGKVVDRHNTILQCIRRPSVGKFYPPVAVLVMTV